MSNTNLFEEKMKKTIQNLNSELDTIRAGRANPHILDKIKVDYYGSETPINQVANITIPEARMILIQPWSNDMLKPIEKAIQTSDLGLNPSSDGKVVRIVFPELTEERRKALTKDVKKKSEDAKVSIRNIRREGIDTFKKQQKANEITEDELNILSDKMQKLTDKYVAQIDSINDAKTKEIMTV